VKDVRKFKSVDADKTRADLRRKNGRFHRLLLWPPGLIVAAGCNRNGHGCRVPDKAPLRAAGLFA
jgi:hypothetical protein